MRWLSKICMSMMVTFSFSAVAGVDLVVNLNDTGFDPSVAGADITYPISVVNNGDTNATGVEAAVTLPANTTFVSASGTGVTCGAPAAGVVTCDLGSLDADVVNGGTPKTFDFTLRTTQSTDITISVSATSDQVDDNTVNDTNQTEQTTIASGADVELAITGNPTAQSGSSYSYSYRVTNNGPDDATNQRVTAPIPPGFEVTSLPGGCSSSGGNIVCNIVSTITNGSFIDISPIVGQISAEGSSTVTSTGTVGLSPSAPGSAAADPSTSNNSATLDITITAGTDLSIDISRSVAGDLLVGQDINFIISSQYTGDDPSTVTVSSTIPNEYTVGTVPANQNGWSCGVAGQVVTCTRPAGVGAGANQDLGDITVPVTVASAGTSVTTSATISAAAPSDPDNSNNTDTDGGVDLLEPTVDLDIDKSGPDPALSVVGVAYEYTLTVSNSGSSEYTGDLSIDDDLPVGLTLNSISNANGWSCSPTNVAGAATITCTFSGATIDATDGTLAGPTLNVTATAPGTTTNSATITATTCNLANCNDGDVDTYDVTASTAANSTDISLIKTADINPIPAGNELTYTLEVVNPDLLATNVEVSDRLANLINSSVGPAEGFVSATFNANGGGATAPGGCSTTSSGSSARQLSCLIDSLPVCTQGANCPTITVVVRPDDPSGTGGNRSNTASAVSEDVADPNTANNSDTLSTAVDSRADVTVSITDAPDPVAAGQDLTYVIAASNAGPSRANSVSIANTLPDNVVFVSATPSAGSCPTTPVAGSTISGGSDQLQCDLGNINDGSQRTVTVVVRPLAVTRSTQLTNAATVSTTTTETNNLTNAASIQTDVSDPVIDLFIDIDEDVDPVAVGDNVIYTVSARNNGPSAAENVRVTVVLPDEGFLSYQSVSANGAVCNSLPAANDVSGDTFTCDIAYLEDDATQTFTITMEGAAKGVGVIDADIASTTMAAFESNAGNNDTDENTTVRTKVDIEVTQKVAQDLAGNPITTVDLREDFQFFIEVVNNTGAGLAEADGVTLTDSLPADMELTGTPVVTVVSGTATSTTCTGVAGDTSFNCTLGTVSAGAQLNIVAPVQIVDVPPGALTNTATVGTTSLDTDASNNSSSGSIATGNVLFSSITGRVFRDLGRDDDFDVGVDSGLEGVALTLIGNTFDNAPVSINLTTNPDGSFTFTNLAASDANGYTITETFSDPDIVDGGETAGSSAGSTAVNDVISGIVLPDATQASGYLFAEWPEPRVGLAKAASALTANGDGTHSVTYTFNIDNAGGASLGDVQITDDLAAIFGTYSTDTIPPPGQYTIATLPSIDSTTNNASLVANANFTGAGANTGLLNAGASSLPDFDDTATAGSDESSTAVVSFTVRFFPTTQTVFNNTAVASGTIPNTAISVSDDSVDGLVTDVDDDNDPSNDTSPTPISISGQDISISKTTGTVVQTGLKQFAVPYSITVSNPDTQFTASFVQVTDNLSLTFPTAETVVITEAPAISNCTGTTLDANASFNGVSDSRLLVGDKNLAPGEMCQIDFIVEVNYGAADLPVDQTNTATASSAVTQGGAPITSSDATGDLSFANLAGVSGRVWRDLDHNRADDGEAGVSSYTVEVVNARDQVVGTTVTDASGNYTVIGLFPSTAGDTDTQYRVQFREPVTGAIYGRPVTNDPTNDNGVIEEGVIKSLPLAPGITTINQSLPLDPAGVIYDSLTRQPINGAQITITGPAGFDPAVHLVGGTGNVSQTTGNDGFYQYLLTNAAPTGTYSLEVIEPAGYLPGGSAIIPACTNSLTVGATPDPLLIQSSNAPPQASVANQDPDACPTSSAQAAANNGTSQYYLSFVLDAATSADVVNNHIPLDVVTEGALTVVKSTPKVNVKRGELIPYTIRVLNNFNASLPNIDVVDQIPPGFKYIEKSASVDGVVTEPVINGRELRWPDATFSANQEKTYKLILVPGAGVPEGEFVNQAWGENNTISQRISNLATATVRIIPDPLFDCTDIIGKVYDDKNQNGYQDKGEEPLPRVRLATVRGLVVTTDEYGRYHVACAAIANADRGSNFIIKLDERSLPSGYRLTTENPRVVRATRGKIEEADFGAVIHRVVRLDITDDSFVSDSLDLQPEYANKVDALVAMLQAKSSVLRISYVTNTGDKKLAKRRMKQLKALIDDQWSSGECCDRPIIEEHIMLESKTQQEDK